LSVQIRHPGALGHRHARYSGLLDQVAVAELRIVAMRIEQRVAPMGLKEFGVGEGFARQR
jgi:hypothetical protein